MIKIIVLTGAVQYGTLAKALAHMLETLEKARSRQPDLLMYMLHGLDEEGRGAIHSKALKKALDFVIKASS